MVRLPTDEEIQKQRMVEEIILLQANQGGTVLSEAAQRLRREMLYNSSFEYVFDEYSKHEEAIKQMIKENDDAEERKRVFNSLASNATDLDYEFWSKLEYWTLEEGLALSFGKNPKIITSDKIKPYAETHYKNGKRQGASPFAIEYEQRMELAKRAIIFKKLYEYSLPILFLGWLKEMGLKFPISLEQKIIKNKGKINSWKDNFDLLKINYDTFAANANNEITDLKQALNQANIRIAELDKITSVSVKASNSYENNDLLPDKSATSLLTILLAIAVKHYRYDPTDKKSTATSNIIHAVSEIGLEITDKTVKSWLDKAVEKLKGKYQLPTKG